MKINIVCSDPTNWIYGRFVREIVNRSNNQIVINNKEKCDVIHFLPYYEVSNLDHPFTVWSSHQEQKDPLKSMFISASKQSDYALCHAQKYVKVLKDNGVKNAKQIIPGVDLEIFKPQNRKSNSKLVLGWVGRSYKSTGRKNEGMLKSISTLPFVDLRITGGKIKEADMPAFYNQCDAIISVSLIEGGPMAHIESTAMGIPFICYDGVGTSQEWDYGTIRVPYNNKQAFLNRLEQMWKNKEHEYYRSMENRQKIRFQAESFTWKSFVNEHDGTWSLCEKQ